MKKLCTLIFVSMLCFSGRLWAQGQGAAPERSGYYQVLRLGVDAAHGVITGYFKDGAGDDSAEIQPQYTCAFYLYGKKNGDRYEIQAWRLKDQSPVMIPGELSFLAPKKEKSKPSIRLKLSQLPGNCGLVDPDLGKASGAEYRLEKAGDWSGVRVVKAKKTYFYENPDPATIKKSYMSRGNILEVLDQKPGWVLADFETKDRGWVKEEDLFPAEPGK
jgi:hypothetical protein